MINDRSVKCLNSNYADDLFESKPFNINETPLLVFFEYRLRDILCENENNLSYEVCEFTELGFRFE